MICTVAHQCQMCNTQTASLTQIFCDAVQLLYHQSVLLTVKQSMT